MAFVAPSTGTTFQSAQRTDKRAMSVATALFFMVGFLTCLNDVLIPHLKSIFELNYSQAMLVQFAFFSSYFVFSYPGGRLVEWLGYKKTMVLGLLVMAAGAATFLPAGFSASFPLFLTALIILAAGMTTVQVAVNPYVTLIGPPATAASRLNLAQAFNSVGTFIAPFLGGLLILSGAAQVTPQRLHSLSAAALQTYRQTQASTVKLPYIGIALMLVLLAIALASIKLNQEATFGPDTQDFRPASLGSAALPSVWKQGWLLAGALGIFAYVGAEVSIGSLLVNYMGLPSIGGLPEATAANYLMLYWGGAMCGRFLGSAVLQRISVGPALCVAALGAGGLVVLSMATTGHLAMFALLAVGFCNSIMFPSIFTLGIQGLGALTSKGSSLMIAAIVGGALIPLATGRLADRTSLHFAFLVPAICYAYIASLGWLARRRSVMAMPVQLEALAEAPVL